MADRALELEEGDVDDVHPSRSVLELMLDDSTEDKLNSLNLDDFADSPRELRHVEKRYALHVIKDEMASPGRERRDDFRPPTDWEVLTMLSGQTPSTLQPGFIIAGHIWRVRDKMVNIRLDTGVEAIVDIRYVADRPPKSCHQVARVGPVRAMIIGVFPERMLAELSMRKTELDMGDAEQRRVRTEEPYDWERAQADKAALDEAARAKKELTKVNRARRQSDHPNFSNVTCAEAEQYLATQQRGDCVIRPSSLGFNHLAVTWKVDDGVYQHLGPSARSCRAALRLILTLAALFPSSQTSKSMASPARRWSASSCASPTSMTTRTSTSSSSSTSSRPLARSTS
jgi:transcription elongation factor SPT6